MSQGIADKSFSDLDFHYVAAPETVDAVLSVPVTKLDADEYIAEDLDGVTESMFGSGNLNFLMLQANQTNEAMAMGGGMEQLGGLENFGSSTPDVIIASAYPGMAGMNSHGMEPGDSRGLSAERPLSQDDGYADSNINHGNFTHNMIGSITASNNATDRLAARPLAGSNGFDGDNGGDGNVVQTQSGVDGRDGNNGSNGTDGGDPVVNVDIDNIVNILGDTDLGDVTNVITETVNDIVNVTEVVNNITGITTDITNNVTDIVTTIIDTVLPGGGLTLALDGIVSDLTHLDLDLIHGDTVLNLINQTLDLTPLTGITSLIPGFSEGLLGIHSIHDLLGGSGHDHLPGDTDLALGLDGALGNLDLINGVNDVVFNPVEDLVGDVDILGDLGLNLFGNNETSNAAGDSDLTLGLDLDLVDNDLLDGGIEVPLDVVEQITGDIDLDLDIATDLLGQTADGLADNLAGGTGTENILTEVQEALGDAVDGLLNGDSLGGDLGDLGGLTDVLPLSGDDPSLPGIQIDFVESDVAGIDLDAPLDVLSGLSGEADLGGGLSLLGDGETDSDAGDTDISIDADINVAGIEVPDVDLDIPLDTVEAITGDIDLDVDAAIELLDTAPDAGGLGDILGDIGGGDLGEVAGGLGDINTWTENTLPDITGGNDLIGDVLGGAHAPTLPDPVGGVAEGLGGLLGGHGGGHHGGGLGGLFG